MMILEELLEAYTSIPPVLNEENEDSFLWPTPSGSPNTPRNLQSTLSLQLNLQFVPNGNRTQVSHLSGEHRWPGGLSPLVTSKPDVSEQPSTFGVKEGKISLRPQKGPIRVDTNVIGFKSCWWFNNTWESLLKGMEFRPEHFIIDVSGKYPRLWTLKRANPIDVNRWYKFGALASIRTVALGFWEISELPDWGFNVVHESLHNNPHLKRGTNKRNAAKLPWIPSRYHSRNKK
ncbi:hypothetical protein ACS0TY_008619 [Phlomoides rotata]